MAHAVIKSGGKQYLVEKDQTIKVEKLLGEAGEKVTFDEVLLVASEKKTQVGVPFIEGAAVEGEIITHSRRDKVWGVKMKAKKRERKLFGHKQHYTEVKITGIK